MDQSVLLLLDIMQMIYFGWTMNIEFSIMWIVLGSNLCIFVKENLGYWGSCWRFYWGFVFNLKQTFLGI